MEYVYIAFRSRSDTIRFNGILKRNGIYSEIVNTPKEAGVGCGLSVKIERKVFPYVKRAVFSLGGKSFAGFFLITVVGGRRIVKSI